MQYILNALRGAIIGMAELVPGISGGTVALIIGIYERALRNANWLISGRFKQVEWGFLASVAVGIFAAVFGFSSILSAFVENQVSVSNALFFGMVAVSIFVPFSMLSAADRTSRQAIIAFILAAISFFLLTGYISEPKENPSFIVIFFAAAIAVCALIMPGVSGSLILLTLGLYAPIITAVSERNFAIIGVFFLGAICGLAAFVKVLNYLLEHKRTPTLAAMAGFMLGSLRPLWPFGSDQDASTGLVFAIMALGALVVALLIFADARAAKTIEKKAS
ncbi:DUF368 domain-containing protein [Corynebacterium flavescens]|uniref:DUF368 domain-containing protein n=1 Tax=Corynebacterium flavescens TaxID=28028 RepID=UPI00289A4C80|nr:DUF368 domain-containing protein [Corynebacterium flavescens]